eukprot:SAG31_NODE_611_length_13558_cov_224.959730_9_plen_294_part_00
MTGYGFDVPGVTMRHYDANVTFHGLAGLTVAEKRALSLQLHVFAPANGPGAAIQSWQGSEFGKLAATEVQHDNPILAVEVTDTGAHADSTVSFGNNTDIQSVDIGGVVLPPNTSDEQGIVACTKACAKRAPACAAWVFCTSRFQGSDHPRCALKGPSFACPIAHENTISGALSASNCSVHPQPPSPNPPRPPPRPPSNPTPGWIDGRINGGPLAIRATQDVLPVRVLVDGSVIEAYWDGGRARMTSRSYPPMTTEMQLGLRIKSNNDKITASIDVYEMGSAWLEPVPIPRGHA